MSSQEKISNLMVLVAGITPDTSINEAAELFLSEQFGHLLCLPVVEQGKVLGTISRYSIMRIFVQRFGREVYGSKPVIGFLNSQPLLVQSDLDIESASRFIREQIQHPITEDFVIVDQDKYCGMGIVLSLLERMEQRARQQSQTLAVMNRNLKSSQAQLVQSEKMASLGQMVAGVAHEINTPLGYVSSNIELARDFSRQLKENFQASEVIVTSAHLFDDMQSLFEDSLYGLQQMGELVTGLKNFSRLDQAKLEKVNLNTCLDSALTIGRHIVRQKAEVIRQYGDDVDVWCVPSQINQVLLNLLTNAAQAIPEFGEIHLRTCPAERHVDIYVRDNGKGMPESVRQRIFDPFYTTKPIGEGTGLGLSISYQIVRQHQGVIRLRSVEGKGTEFAIRLPRNANQSENTEIYA